MGRRVEAQNTGVTHFRYRAVEKIRHAADPVFAGDLVADLADTEGIPEVAPREMPIQHAAVEDHDAGADALEFRKTTAGDEGTQAVGDYMRWDAEPDRLTPECGEFSGHAIKASGSEQAGERPQKR